jgi:hypothetical protein
MTNIITSIYRIEKHRGMSSGMLFFAANMRRFNPEGRNGDRWERDSGSKRVNASDPR